jgi:hypothetical protein
MVAEFKHIKQADRQKDSSESASFRDTLPSELKDAIREFMRYEWQRLRRDEMFYLRRGMKSELDDIEKELDLESE